MPYSSNSHFYGWRVKKNVLEGKFKLAFAGVQGGVVIEIFRLLRSTPLINNCLPSITFGIHHSSGEQASLKSYNLAGIFCSPLDSLASQIHARVNVTSHVKSAPKPWRARLLRWSNTEYTVCQHPPRTYNSTRTVVHSSTWNLCLKPNCSRQWHLTKVR